MLHTLDLHFQGRPEVIASYVLRRPNGVVLIETGPGSALAQLYAGLDALGIALTDITDILLTHIHLDHAGAAGRLARETGARVHVHHVGAPHLIGPERLLASAARIYGERMQPLWGEFLPVPEQQIHPLFDEDVIEAAGLRFFCVDTPGHANHHMAYWFDGLCFTGDVAGVRLPGHRHIRIPTPPPEFDLTAWRASLDRLRALHPERLCLTHFGPVDDADEHLATTTATLDATVAFVRSRWQAGETPEEIAPALGAWLDARAANDGCDAEAARRYEMATPLHMQASGLVRYFRKAQAQ